MTNKFESKNTKRFNTTIVPNVTVQVENKDEDERDRVLIFFVDDKTVELTFPQFLDLKEVLENM